MEEKKLIIKQEPKLEYEAPKIEVIDLLDSDAVLTWSYPDEDFKDTVW